MKFTIDRNKWLRGEGQYNSRLLRGSDRKMCCVGQYLEQAGMPKALLEGWNDVTDLGELPEGTAWLRTQRGQCNSNAACSLYGLNDERNVSEDRREAEIARLFAEQGVEVEFVN